MRLLEGINRTTGVRCFVSLVSGVLVYTFGRELPIMLELRADISHTNTHTSDLCYCLLFGLLDGLIFDCLHEQKGG